MVLSQKGVLERWDGGFWTYDGAGVIKKQADGTRVPEWYCRTRTLRVLERDCRVELNEQIGYCRMLTDGEFRERWSRRRKHEAMKGV
jgi:hypothetical protein